MPKGSDGHGGSPPGSGPEWNRWISNPVPREPSSGPSGAAGLLIVAWCGERITVPHASSRGLGFQNVGVELKH